MIHAEGVIRVYACDVVEGDELLRGPQGHNLPEAPTVFSVVTRPDGVIAARLIDEAGFSYALWHRDTSLVVLRKAAA